MTTNNITVAIDAEEDGGFVARLSTPENPYLWESPYCATRSEAARWAGRGVASEVMRDAEDDFWLRHSDGEKVEARRA